MSGHSHWAGIKHKKALVDAKRGKLWSRLAKAIIIAAKAGGGDPDANLRLRYAIDDAKAVSMPKENIQRAIKRGTGELDGGNLEEIVYEGYGSGGIAILCEVLTDNRNRTAGEIRRIFELSDGKLGSTGCVAWMFESKGLFLVPADAIEEDKLMELALEAGADDVQATDDGKFEVTCNPPLYQQVSKALADAGITPEASQITRIAGNMVDISDHDDVQNVSANFNIPQEVLKAIGEA
jgi:YebC/PmpR family DNA-binding regulatory protein